MTIWIRGRSVGKGSGITTPIFARAGALHVEAVLYKCQAESCSTSIFGSVSGVKEIGEEKADELKGHAYHAVPDEGEDRADWKAVNVDLVRCHARSDNGGLPIWWSSVCGRLFICL